MTPAGTTTFLRKPASTLAFLGIFLIGLAASSAARAGDDAPSAFIAGLGQQAIAIMQDASLSATDRQSRFRTLMAQDFDLPKIAQFVLGSYWTRANEGERQQFTTTFGDFMTSVYSSRFAEYDPKSFHVTTQFTKNETTTVVGSEITRVATGEEIDLDWIVAKTPDSYKVVDITAGGMSLSRAQREEFSSVVRRNGESIPNLIKQLQAKASEIAASVPQAAATPQ